MHQKLAVASVGNVYEPEPAIVEIELTLIDGSTTTFRLNVFAAQELLRKLTETAGQA